MRHDVTLCGGLLHRILHRVRHRLSSGGKGNGYSWGTKDCVGQPTDFDLSLCVLGPRVNRMGDMNCDGGINNFDIDPFVRPVTDPAGCESQYPTCDLWLVDMTLDGLVNNFDIDPWLLCFTQRICP